jgi:hypothetical protein
MFSFILPFGTFLSPKSMFFPRQTLGFRVDFGGLCFVFQWLGTYCLIPLHIVSISKLT